MSADIKNLRIRLKSVSSTLHLTSAMGLVASSKIRKATDAMVKGKEYAAALEKTVSILTGCQECKKSPYMEKPQGDEPRCDVRLRINKNRTRRMKKWKARNLLRL